MKTLTLDANNLTLDGLLREAADGEVVFLTSQGEANFALVAVERGFPRLPPRLQIARSDPASDDVGGDPRTLRRRRGRALVVPILLTNDGGVFAPGLRALRVASRGESLP